MSLIEVDKLTKRYGDVAALREVSFTIDEGEWIAVMGPSGSGKTTLVNLLSCLDRPTSGAIRIAGRDLSGRAPEDLAVFRREHVGLVFQQFHLIPYLTALENVMLAQYLHSMEDEPEARKALEEVGLGERMGHLPGQLSGGEQQRVCIARALINHPKIVLADEPTGNLDEGNEQSVMGIFARLHNEGRTIVMVTHDPEIGRLANRRFELHHGALTGVTRSTHEEEEMFEEVLQQLWEAEEAAGGEDCADRPSLLEIRGVLMSMLSKGLVHPSDGGFAMTDAGRGRARDLVRRHRLAERLFRDTLEMPREALEATACAFEHVLSEAAADSICRFLSHPATCPHGKPIPRGACCAAPAVSGE
ncbi:MAG: ATP-binding cassette domain-containing protein [Planctomycetes bacterium]|nr:ATP-binding cassette domain-containing protein [Planctomycetota bacterium]